MVIVFQSTYLYVKYLSRISCDQVKIFIIITMLASRGFVNNSTQNKDP